MDNQSIEQCKYLLLARCSRLEYNLDCALPHYACNYSTSLPGRLSLGVILINLNYF
jgi:hypothetical protein